MQSFELLRETIHLTNILTNFDVKTIFYIFKRVPNPIVLGWNVTGAYVQLFIQTLMEFIENILKQKSFFFLETKLVLG